MSGDMRKLPFHVVFASSEEDGHPASELNHHGPTTRGWISSNFCEYPQEIGIQFDEGMVSVAQIQLLSHQYLIATKIELFAGVGDSYETAKFKRLGYLSLDSNQRSNYRARELKSVYVDAAGTYFKFRVHRCYLNNQNHTNQVSIVAISVLGNPGGSAAAVAAAPAHAAKRDAGHRRAPGGSDLAIDVGMDPETASKLREVARLKNEAVASEDYAAAKQYKEVETRIRAAASQLARLHAEKQTAVANEDYDLAKRLKDEIMRIRRSVMGVAQPAAPAPTSAPRHHGGHPQGAYHGDVPHGGMPHDAPGHSRGPSHGGAASYRGDPVHSSPTHRSAPGHGGSGSVGPSGGGGGFPGDGGGYPAAESPQRTHRSRFSHQGSDRGGGFGGPGSHHAHDDGAHHPHDDGYDMPPPPAQHNDVMDEMERPLPGNRSRNIYEEAADTAAVERPQSRAIKPAGADTAARAIDADDEVIGFGSGAAPASVRPTAQGDASQLDGVPGAENLPAPDPISESKVAELSELVAVLGEYVVRCFYSKKPWTLRDAALQKVQLDLRGYEQPPAQVAKVVLALCTTAATKDKIAQVFLTSILLIKPVVALCSSMRSSEFLPLLEPLGVALVDKLGDNNARCRDATFQALVNLAHEKLVGAPFVTSLVLRKLKKRQAAAWRPLLTRLQLLHNIIDLLGLGRASGLSADNLIRFLVDTNACAHSNGDVREAAKEICVAIHKTEGDSIIGRLGHLRKKQLEEYKAAFNGGAAPSAAPRAGPGAGGGGGGRGRGGGGRGGGGGGRGRGGRGGGGGGGGGRGAKRANERKEAAAPPPQAQQAGGQGGEDDEEETECQFCGWPFPPNLTEPDLDMHYWQDCPMLTQCPACQQVIEISTLYDHLLVECEHQAKFSRCERCGEVVAAAELEAHTKANTCAPAVSPDVANRCPLCHKDVEPDAEGWLKHLLDQGCPDNPRKRLA